MQDYTLQDLKDAVKQAVAEGKAPWSHRVTTAFITELLEPLQGLVMHAPASLRGAEVPESWHEAIIWLMPKGTATRNLDAYRPIALGQQDMRMLMTPPHAQFHSGPSPQGDGHGLAVQASRALWRQHRSSLRSARYNVDKRRSTIWPLTCPRPLDTAPHGALTLLLRHMGVPEELIRLFHTLSCGSTVRIVTLHGPTPSIRLHRFLQQGTAESAVLYPLLLERFLRCLARKAQGDARHAVPPLVQAYCTTSC